MFLRRRIRIQSLNLTVLEAENSYHFVLVVEEEEEVIQRLMLQIDKQVDVFETAYHKQGSSIDKAELLLDVYKNKGAQ